MLDEAAGNGAAWWGICWTTDGFRLGDADGEGLGAAESDTAAAADAGADGDGEGRGGDAGRAVCAQVTVNRLAAPSRQNSL